MIDFGNTVLSGQHVGWSLDKFKEDFERNILGLEDISGKLPAIIGVDFGVHLSRENLDNVVPRLIEWHERGGIIQIDFHANNPWTGKSSSDTTRGPLSDLYTPGDVYDAWHATLDTTAYGMTMLRDAGVQVLWRPLHEAAFDKAFWWGTLDEISEFKRVWWNLYGYLAGKHNLDNLIWVYASANVGHWYDVTRHYPGGAFVDIVGIDVSSDNAAIFGNGYEQILTLEKPFALTEVHPGYDLDGTFDATYIIESIALHYPETQYFHAWHSEVWSTDVTQWKLRALRDLDRVGYLMNDERVGVLRG